MGGSGKRGKNEGSLRFLPLVLFAPDLDSSIWPWLSFFTEHWTAMATKVAVFPRFLLPHSLFSA